MKCLNQRKRENHQWLRLNRLPKAAVIHRLLHRHLMSKTQVLIKLLCKWRCSSKRSSELQSRTKRLGQRASSPLPPLTMLTIGWFFSSFCWKKCDIFQHWLGGWGIHDLAQVSQLLLARIIAEATVLELFKSVSSTRYTRETDTPMQTTHNQLSPAGNSDNRKFKQITTAGATQLPWLKRSRESTSRWTAII